MQKQWSVVGGEAVHQPVFQVIEPMSTVAQGQWRKNGEVKVFESVWIVCRAPLRMSACQNLHVQDTSLSGSTVGRFLRIDTDGCSRVLASHMNCMEERSTAQNTEVDWI